MRDARVYTRAHAHTHMIRPERRRQEEAGAAAGLGTWERLQKMLSSACCGQAGIAPPTAPPLTASDCMGGPVLVRARLYSLVHACLICFVRFGTSEGCCHPFHVQAAMRRMRCARSQHVRCSLCSSRWRPEASGSHEHPHACACAGCRAFELRVVLLMRPGTSVHICARARWPPRL